MDSGKSYTWILRLFFGTLGESDLEGNESLVDSRLFRGMDFRSFMSGWRRKKEGWIPRSRSVWQPSGARIPAPTSFPPGVGIDSKRHRAKSVRRSSIRFHSCWCEYDSLRANTQMLLVNSNLAAT